MKKYLIIPILISFLISCESKQSKNNKKPNIEECVSKNIFIKNSSKWNILFEKYKALDSLYKSNAFSEIQNDYYTNESSGLLKLTLIFDKKKTIAIKYPVFDVVGNFLNYKEVFFDEKNEPFALINNSKTKEIILFDINKGLFYKDNLTDNIEKSNPFIDLDYQCEIVKNIDNIMHRFSALGRYTPINCINSKEDIEIISDSVAIYSDSSGKDSKIIKYLYRGMHLKYLISDNNIFNINNNETYMIKVKVKNETGWVFFLPQNFMAIDELD